MVDKERIGGGGGEDGLISLVITYQIPFSVHPN